MKTIFYIISMMLIPWFIFAGSKVECKKGTLGKTHRAMNENLFMPSSQMIDSQLQKLETLKKEGSNISEEYHQELIADIRSIHSKMKSATSVVLQMVTKTDRAMEDVKLLEDSKERYLSAKEKMILYATKTASYYQEVVDTSKTLLEKENIELTEAIDAFDSMKWSIMHSSDSTARGHYYVH